MNGSEKVAYIANVLTIAGADDVVTLQEKLVIKRIIKKIQADSSVVEEATRLIASGDYKLKPLGTPRQRSANIEDMIMVALADGKLSPSEIKPIEKITDLLGYVQADMDMMVKRAQAGLKRIVKSETAKRTVKKPEPRRTTSRKARKGSFQHVKPRETMRTPRPARARTLPERQPAEPEKTRPVIPAMEKKETLKPAQQPQPSSPPKPEKRFQPPDIGIMIEFCSSSSPLLTRDLRAFESADESGDYEWQGEKWHYGIWLTDSPDALASTSITVSKLPRRRVHINGVETPWNRVFGFCACARMKAMSEHPAEYCFGLGSDELNTWGCRKADMNWSAAGEWFVCGAFKSEDVYIFDKEEIAKRLQENLGPYQFCPHLNWSYIQSAMDAMPGKVKVWGRWQFRETDTPGKGAVSRNIRRSVHGCTYTDNRLVEGVVPVGIRGGLKIIRQAVKNSGYEPLDDRLLSDTSKALTNM